MTAEIMVAKSRPAAYRKRAATCVPPFALGELVGRHARVASSSCKGRRGTEGTVVDETENTLVLETAKGRKTIPKRGCVFEFPEGSVRGDAIAHRPEDRTKKLAKLAARR
jgi:ribonuclease P protein subunit POP4